MLCYLLIMFLLLKVMATTQAKIEEEDALVCKEASLFTGQLSNLYLPD